jgi:hypothetical protein
VRHGFELEEFLFLFFFQLDKPGKMKRDLQLCVLCVCFVREVVGFFLGMFQDGEDDDVICRHSTKTPVFEKNTGWKKAQTVFLCCVISEIDFLLCSSLIGGWSCFYSFFATLAWILKESKWIYIYRMSPKATGRIFSFVPFLLCGENFRFWHSNFLFCFIISFI